MQVISGAQLNVQTAGGPSYAASPRILTDRGLLRQIREELTRCAMALTDIARLENVTPEFLQRVIESALSPADDPSWGLRAFARGNSGYESAAWRTSRGRLSRRHIIDPEGGALCGIPLGSGRELLDGGPCGTCAERAGIRC